MKKLLLFISLITVLTMSGCAWEAVSKVPAPSDMFMTTGDVKDGDYEPLGMVSAIRANIKLSCLGVFPPLYPMMGPEIQDVLYKQLSVEAKKMGANAVINIKTTIVPASIIPGLLWFPAVNISGMAVKM